MLNNSGKTTTLRSFLFVVKSQTTLREIAFALRNPVIQGWLVVLVSAIILLGLIENGRLRIALAILVAILTATLVTVIFVVRTEQSIYSHVRPLGARLRVVIWHLIGRTESGLYRWREAVRWYERVLDSAAVPRPSDLLGIVLCDLGGAFIFGGRKQQALAEFDRGLRVYEQDTIASDLGRARILIGRMNAFIHFGDYSATFNQTRGWAEIDFLDGMRFCSSQDPIVTWGDEAYGTDVAVTNLTVADPYGASKAHCQYAWGLLEEEAERALWHARMALAYSQLVEDSVFSPTWGLRDGAVGGYWREAVALFTIADCYTLLGELGKAEEYYRQSHRRIPYQERRWYFMGHYWWLYLCRCGRVEEAHKWLEEVLRVSVRDGYCWRIALTHMHCGDLERCFRSTASGESIRGRYETALGIASEFGLGPLAAGCEERIASLELGYKLAYTQTSLAV